jgi:hypothetical protein
MDFLTSGVGLGGPGMSQGKTFLETKAGGGGHPICSFADAPSHDTGPEAGQVLVLPTPSPPNKRAVWIQRIWLVVFVLFCLEVGIVLTWCPWTKVWSENSLLVTYPNLKNFLMYGFVRGIISGLGLVNVWMGISEAIHYRETSG